MIKNLSIIVFSLCSLNIQCQDTLAEFNPHTWQAPYLLSTPEKWGVERFLIPISFAPQILYKGVEDIRFAPGWAKATSDGYWSYAFLWYLDGTVKLNEATLNSNMKPYYDGLIAINGSGIPKDSLAEVVTSLREIKKNAGDKKTFAGTIVMTDYMQKKPITLNCKVHLKFCPRQDKTFVFYELSPQPLSHKIWLSLDKLWLDFKCDKNSK